MKAQHTPAPWILGNPLPEENRIQIMHKEAPRPDDIAPTWVVANVNLCIGEESEANARLIAHAPELLEALKTLWNHSTPYLAENEATEEETEAWKSAAAAIAKATGEEA